MVDARAVCSADRVRDGHVCVVAELVDACAVGSADRVRGDRVGAVADGIITAQARATPTDNMSHNIATDTLLSH